MNPAPKLIVLALIFLALFFAHQGYSMHLQVPIEEAKFHLLQEGYYSVAKSEREAALTGSALNQQLIQIQNYPSTLLELKLVGMGRILMGIFTLLLGILIALLMMPHRLAGLVKKK